ncbi:MAG: cytochrome c biogenesis protein CcsA [Alphaproteobacteria bacterium]|nr:cytochrome c biogenesis protein CcsA [Rhodospirillales bacterium]MCW9046032.1 cytochrome c biogenesis protein CcsA [Alphaproteobacteria bacterium]
MMDSFVYGISALVALVPALILSFKGEGQRNMLFWAALAVAIAGTAVLVRIQMSAHWQTNLSLALWVTILVTLVLFAGANKYFDQAWRLSPLLYPYLFLMGTVALVSQTTADTPMSLKVPTGWIHAHIFVSVITYGLVTLAAVASLAAFVQERALKSKQTTTLSQKLPSVFDSEFLSVKLLFAAQVILGLGLLTGMIAQYFVSGSLFVLDHKTLLSIGTFFVIGGLLLAHHKIGVRGRQATRLMLLAYLLLTLGYPGVKFIGSMLS